MKKLSVSIMMHHTRKEFLPYLLEKLGSDTPVTIDYNNEGEWETCKKAWKQYDKDAEWHVVIQDDAIVCNNFIDRAIQTIKQSNDILKQEHICNFYFGRNRASTPIGDEAIKLGYWVNNYPKWGVAICVPTKYIDEMIEFCDNLDMTEHGTRDDSRIAKFCGYKKMKVYFPMPSIISHRHGKSLVGDPGEKRSAYKFIDDMVYNQCMPHSTYNGKQIFRHWILDEKNVKSFVDFGAGAGWYGRIIKKLRPDIEDSIAVEAFPEYIAQYDLKNVYKKVIEGKIEDIRWPEADLAIFGDVIEHFDKNTAIEILRKAEKKYKCIVMNIPVGHWPQDDVRGNELERHLSEWDFKELCELFDWRIQAKWDNKAILIKY